MIKDTSNSQRHTPYAEAQPQEEFCLTGRYIRNSNSKKGKDSIFRKKKKKSPANFSREKGKNGFWSKSWAKL